MLEADIKKFKDTLGMKLENAKDLELHWEAKAYMECINMLNSILKKNGLEAAS